VKAIIQKHIRAISFTIALCSFLPVASNFAQTITISDVTGNMPFCPGAAVVIRITLTGTFGGTNVFKAQLSNSSGSFSTGVTTLGSASGSGVSLINGTIPTGAAAGTNYLIRVISSSPSVISAPYFKSITILSTTQCGVYWNTSGNGNITSSNWLGSQNNSGFGFKTNNITRAYLTSTGELGIGTSTPTEMLEVTGNIRSNSVMKSPTAEHDIIKLGNARIYKDSNDIIIHGYQPSLFISGSPTIGNVILAPKSLYFLAGNVGIGTYSPQYKLDVCGTIRAKEIKVETGWCDYVFDENYKLRSIPDLEKYITEHKHLPGIVPASQVEKEGLTVGEMSKAMMEKIEELTLYIIQLKKENDELSKKVDTLLKKSK
jgi:hypothetical protein